MPIIPEIKFAELAARYRALLSRRDAPKLKELVAATGDDDLAHLLDSMDDESKSRAFRALPPERQALVIYELSEYGQEVILRTLTGAELKAMIDAVATDDAVDVIQLLDEAARARVVADLRKSDPHGLLPLLSYDEDSAGGLMRLEMTRLRGSMTVDEARRQIAREGATKRSSLFKYVTDVNDALIGTLRTARLLQAAPEVLIADIAEPPIATIPPRTDQEVVAKVFEQHDALELPVVDGRGRVIGIITADDVLDVVAEEYAEDLSKLVGVDEDDSVNDPVLRTFRRRFPWLVVNLGTSVLAAAVVGLYQDVIARTVLLAAFMPIIAGMGGNAATQTLGVVIRAMAIGDMHSANVRRAIFRQVAAGTLNGLANGVIMGAAAYAWTGSAALAWVIAVAMTLNLLVAGLGGVAVPVALRAAKIDPAVASTVFVTTMTDVCGFFVFLGLASAFL